MSSLVVAYTSFETIERGDKLLFLPVTTWSKGGLFVYGSGDFPHKIKDALTDYMEQFSAAWLMHNQSEATSDLSSAYASPAKADKLTPAN